MEQLLTFEFEEVQNSIVTPSSQYFGDYLQPYSFLEFLKNTNNNYTPKVYNDFYIEYLKNWANAKNTTVLTQEELIFNQYTDLLREITLTYSTADERRFLSNIDFNDPEDLEIAIPFFSRKIKEIVLLYKSSRDKMTFQIEKNKRRGTESSVQLALRDGIVNFLGTSDRFKTLNIDLSAVNANLKIQVDELVDTYGDYFNLNPNPPADYTYGSLEREVLYSSNLNEIDYRDFVDLSGFLKKYVFNRVFLEQIGKRFTINTDITYDPICEPFNPIGDYLEVQSVAGITPEQYRDLRAQLIRKYIGVDYYFIVKSGSGEIATGVLFEADNPSGNLLNVNNASTATILSDELKALRKVGLYFAPEKQSVIRFNKTDNLYAINVDDLKENVTYVYPNPELYGKNYSSDYPIIFYYDSTSITKTQPNTYTLGDPKNGPKDQNFYAYYSRQQTYETEQINKNALQGGFSQLFDKGYVFDWKQDVYGNEYGLVKDQNGQFFKSTLSFEEVVDDGSIIKMLPLNGWVFSDPISGANFDYSESGTYDGFANVYKSGISLSGGNFASSSVDHYLNFRSFFPYQGIPSYFNIYPPFTTPELLRTLPVSGSRTELSTITGSATPKLITEKESLNGVIYVKDVVSSRVSSLSTALTATFDKYSQTIKDQIFNQVQAFDLIYDTIVLKTQNYLVFDKINYNETGFIKPVTFNIYLSTNPLNPFDGFSNIFFEPFKNIMMFFRTAVLSSFSNDNGKILYPEIYKFDIDKHRLTKLFPAPSLSVNTLSSNFTFTNIYSTLNVVEVVTQNISYNKTTEMYTINFIGYDSNKSPYLFDHKFSYDGENLKFHYSNVYTTNNYKEVSNFYSLSDNGSFFINRIPGTEALYYTSLNFTVTSNFQSGITLDNIQGFLQL